MKTIYFFLLILFIASWKKEEEKVYIGSTPAGTVIKAFLRIPLLDSIDFIRWKIIFRGNLYQLQCNYGIGKPNTNGFINDGKKININGEYRKLNNYLLLQNGPNTLKAVELNSDLIHLLNTDNSLLVGNGGWSYTLNNANPSGNSQFNGVAPLISLKDSMGFQGRTPCNIPGVIPSGSLCYKLKWYIVFYANTKQNEPAGYKVFSTAWRKENGRTGNWKIITRQNGKIIYQLNDENGNGYLYLLKLDEHILLFIDEQEKLLVGDKDFSYTLNRSF